MKVGLTGDDIARVMQALAKKNPKRKSSSFEELYAAINKFIRQECGGKDQAIGAPAARAKRTKKAKREDEKWRAEVEDRRDKRAGTDAGSHRAIAKHFGISRQRVARILASPRRKWPALDQSEASGRFQCLLDAFRVSEVNADVSTRSRSAGRDR